MSESATYTIEDLKAMAQYLRLQQLREVHPDYAQLSATAKVRVMVELQRRQDVPHRRVLKHMNHDSPDQHGLPVRWGVRR